MQHTPCCDVDAFLKAMADETRQRILSLLTEREMSVSELCQHVEIGQPTVSHHLAVLHRANMVVSRHEGRHIFYRTSPACVVECTHEFLVRITQEKHDSE